MDVLLFLAAILFGIPLLIFFVYFLFYRLGRFAGRKIPHRVLGRLITLFTILTAGWMTVWFAGLLPRHTLALLATGAGYLTGVAVFLHLFLRWAKKPVHPKVVFREYSVEHEEMEEETKWIFWDQDRDVWDPFELIYHLEMGADDPFFSFFNGVEEE